ncbi:sugar ABC transporter substrate-binding protein [Palleronia caenipelagi]|uniref:Sugar ABC transporter substrate-binding protein n=1 Tax=Palleronia caenipelagi TaxID=2489174 RepID=A0A547PP02_9RHOB|nr:sugar ABC transporter substrate-binding protein [Palleronia caenipelagi]TRD15883.1 sugar ABC transporter substrate-binding protein [Palleronia caenipelagi]
MKTLTTSLFAPTRRAFGAAAVAAAMIAGLGASQALAEIQHPEGFNPDEWVIVASVINTTNPYMISNIEGAEAISKALGIDLEIVNSNNSSQTSISSILAILASGKKPIMFVNTVASSDAPPIVDAVKQSGGYVSIWWNKPDEFKPQAIGDNFVAFQKHTGVDSGRCGAQALAEALGGEGNVILLPGVQDSTTSKTRVAGFKAEIAENYPNITILEERPSNWDPQLGARNAKDLIVKYGDQINGVWSADDGMQIGAMQSFENAGMLDKVKFSSDGLYPKTLEDIKSGRGDNAIVGETFHRGYMASAIGLYTAYLAASGQIVPSELEPEKRESFFKLSCVTPANYEQYLQYDEPGAPDAFVERLVETGPWNTEPVPLVGGGVEVLPES